ncbi:MAG: hypothetical protein L0Y56_05090, partial [Nitrospira sp.]|nr:hypothetical protein [Nitrospira sp.]
FDVLPYWRDDGKSFIGYLSFYSSFIENQKRVHSNDLDRWVQFYIVDMGFDLLNVKRSAALLSNGHILLKLQEENAGIS